MTNSILLLAPNTPDFASRLRRAQHTHTAILLLLACGAPNTANTFASRLRRAQRTVHAILLLLAGTSQQPGDSTNKIFYCTAGSP